MDKAGMVQAARAKQDELRAQAAVTSEEYFACVGEGELLEAELEYREVQFLRWKVMRVEAYVASISSYNTDKEAGDELTRVLSRTYEAPGWKVAWAQHQQARSAEMLFTLHTALLTTEAGCMLTPGNITEVLDLAPGEAGHLRKVFGHGRKCGEPCPCPKDVGVVLTDYGREATCLKCGARFPDQVHEGHGRPHPPGRRAFDEALRHYRASLVPREGPSSCDHGSPACDGCVAHDTLAAMST